MDQKTLGANIRKHRIELGLTQETAAERCGLSENYYRQIELGNKVPQLKTFIRIAEVLETSADKLLDGILVFSDDTHSTELSDKISALPAKKKKLVLAQIDSLLKSLDSF